MCVNGGILDSSIWKNCEINKFFHILEIDLRSKLMSCMNMWWTTKNTWWTIWTTFKHVKNIQSYLNNPLACFNLNLTRKSWLGHGFISFFLLMEAHIYSNKSFIHFLLSFLLCTFCLWMTINVLEFLTPLYKDQR